MYKEGEGQPANMVKEDIDRSVVSNSDDTVVKRRIIIIEEYDTPLCK